MANPEVVMSRRLATVLCTAGLAFAIGGAGANGYSFHLDYLGVLPSNQNVYAPPRSSLPR